ncbi:MAG: hypothetical protein ACRELD_07315 [Longimicrobiales bacterium]
MTQPHIPPPPRHRWLWAAGLALLLVVAWLLFKVITRAGEVQDVTPPPEPVPQAQVMH